MSLVSGMPKSLARIAAVAVVAAGASACSSLPNWADPTKWMGGDDQSASADTSTDNAQTPDIAAIPDKPVAPSTKDERQQVADTLKADRADAQYSADSLRGGTEPSAAPPPDAPPATAASSAASPDASASAVPSGTASEPAAIDTPSSETPVTPVVAAAVPASPSPSAQIAGPAPDAAAAAQPEPAAPAPAAEVASTQRSAVEPSAPAAAAGNDQLGFQPSQAPPLDPSVAHFVPRAVIERYEQTSTASSVTPAPSPPPPPRPDPAQTSMVVDPSTDYKTSLASNSVAGTNATAVAASSAASSYAGMASPAAHTTERQSTATAVVFFPHDAAVLSTKAREQIRATAQSFQPRAGAGFVRVVGHASSRTTNMPLPRHLEVVFEHSQAFATAVAQELIRDGVPADKVLIEAVGDSQPVYFESMPQGEAGNRRAEIFL